jgi:hypothetical protein
VGESKLRANNQNQADLKRLAFRREGRLNSVLPCRRLLASVGLLIESHSFMMGSTASNEFQTKIGSTNIYSFTS